MGNPQHLEWLLEGVDAWNARRESTEPDLEGLSITAFLLHEVGASGSQTDLSGFDFGALNLNDVSFSFLTLVNCNFEDAILDEADLSNCRLHGADFNLAELQEAFLKQSDLRSASFRKANLSKADMRGAQLDGTNFDRSYLLATDVRTMYSSNGDSTRTDLSRSVNLTQQQLEQMQGDTGTILPDGLTHPPHWPYPPEARTSPGEQKGASHFIGDPLAQDVATSDETAKPAPNSSFSLIQQANFLIATAPAAADTARFAAHQIEEAVNRFHNETGANTSDEGELLLTVAKSFVVLGTAIEDASADLSEVEALKATIAAQQAEIERLTELLANSPSARQQIIVGALGAAGGVALTSGAGYIFGPEGQQIITNLIDLIRGGGGAPPSLPPTIGT